MSDREVLAKLEGFLAANLDRGLTPEQVSEALEILRHRDPPSWSPVPGVWVVPRPPLTRVEGEMSEAAALEWCAARWACEAERHLQQLRDNSVRSCLAAAECGARHLGENPKSAD